MIIDNLFTRPIFESQMDPITQFASNAHEEWRRNFDPTGTKPRVKKNSDGTEGDINVPFEKLHPDWKKENLAAAHAAHHAVKRFGRDMEKAAEHVHNEWMKRNPKGDWNAAQHVPYDDLPEDEKEKDRAHVRTMMRLMGHHPEQGVAEGSAANDYFTRRKSEEERIAGTRAPAKNKKNPANTDYAKRRKQQDVDESFRNRPNHGREERHDLDPSDWYKKVGTKMYTASIYPRQVAQAQREGWHPTKEQARANASPEGVAEGSDEPTRFDVEIVRDVHGDPIGEIYLDHLGWAYHHYKKDYGESGFDSEEDAFEELEDAEDEYQEDKRIAAALRKKHIPTTPNDKKEKGVAEGLSKRDQKDVAAIRAAIERLQAQLKQPNADKAAIQQSIAHEQKRLALYKQGVAEGLVGDVNVINYTKVPVELKPGQAQIHGWGPNEQPIYRVMGADGKEVITSNKRKMLQIVKEQGVAEATGDERFDSMMGQITGGTGARQGVDNLNKSLTARSGSNPETALAKWGQEFIKWLENLCREFDKQGVDRFSKLEKLSEFEDGGETMAYWLIEVAKQTKTSGITLADIQEFSSEFNTYGMWPWQQFPIAWSQGEWQDYKDQWTGNNGYIANLRHRPEQGVAEARTSAAQRLSTAWDKQRAKSDASLARTPSSIPKKQEPKKADPVPKTMSEHRTQRRALMAQMLKGR
jgi:hypothetical protein